MTTLDFVPTMKRAAVILTDHDGRTTRVAHDVDGIGLLWAEFMVAQIDKYPSYMLGQKQGNEFVYKLSERLTDISKAFQDSEDVEENAMVG